MSRKPGENDIKAGRILRGYVLLPIAAAIFLAVITIWLYFIDTMLSVVGMTAFVVYVIVTVVYFNVSKKGLKKDLLRYIDGYETIEREFIDDVPLPYAITDKNGYIILYNKRFARLYDGDVGTGNLLDLFKELEQKDLYFYGEEKNLSVVYDKRNYRLCIRKCGINENIKGRELVLEGDNADFVLEAFMFDETEITAMTRKSVEEQVVVANICIDNYIETIDQTREIEGSIAIALVDKTINEYFRKIDGIVKKGERNRYFIIFKRKYLSALQNSKFDILDEVKAIDTGTAFPVTLSIGVGVDSDYKKSSEFSKRALELALGRGGDQAVVREGERMYFYGGKTKRVEKNIRVKARLVALSMREIFMSKERVVVMGHKMADTDSFGAALGIYKAAKALGMKAHIVLNGLTNTVQPVLENFFDDPEYKGDAFVSSDQAAKFVDEDTVVVVVDVNRPSIFERPDLIRKTKTVIMIDHHIQSGERVENLVLSYIEPTASSASEMVTELLQYITEDEIILKKTEAEALYAGILIDTNYFSKNTGVRTFEAAAFLKKNGVDVTRVKGLFNDTLDDFKAKAETIKNAEIIEEGFAMAVSPSKGIENPTIVAAQVANELLDICGIIGSFVLTEYDGKIYISARSVGNVNVQLVMERMGGGGHLNMAGAQMPGGTIEDTAKKLKMTLKKMIEEGVFDESYIAGGR